MAKEAFPDLEEASSSLEQARPNPEQVNSGGEEAFPRPGQARFPRRQACRGRKQAHYSSEQACRRSGQARPGPEQASFGTEEIFRAPKQIWLVGWHIGWTMQENRCSRAETQRRRGCATATEDCSFATENTEITEIRPYTTRIYADSHGTMGYRSRKCYREMRQTCERRGSHTETQRVSTSNEQRATSDEPRVTSHCFEQP